MASPTSSERIPQSKAWDPLSDDMPVNPSRPPPLYWGPVTVIKRGDPRRGKLGHVEKRHPTKEDGQWVYDVKFPDESEKVKYLHNDLYMGQP